jgi:hypothetical protein
MCSNGNDKIDSHVNGWLNTNQKLSGQKDVKERKIGHRRVDHNTGMVTYKKVCLVKTSSWSSTACYTNSMSSTACCQAVLDNEFVQQAVLDNEFVQQAVLDNEFVQQAVLDIEFV